MNDTVAQDRSPRSPSLPLQDSISLTAKLFDGIRTATVAPNVAVKPLGYGSTNGAAMSTLATLAQYGLIDRSGGKVTVTPLGIKILHPKGDDQRETAIREAALFPRVMKDLYDGYLECAESVITGHLIQSGFTADRAKKLASIHAANKTFAKLAPQEQHSELSEDADVTVDKKETSLTSGAAVAVSVQQPAHQPPSSNTVLAQYSIPLGSNQATLVFTGSQLTADDFDELIDFVAFSKRQFQRAIKAKEAHAPTISDSAGILPEE